MGHILFKLLIFKTHYKYTFNLDVWKINLMICEMCTLQNCM